MASIGDRITIERTRRGSVGLGLALIFLMCTCRGALQEGGGGPEGEVTSPSKSALVAKEVALNLAILATPGSYEHSIEAPRRTRFSRNASGSVLIDARGGKSRFPMPQGVRQFDDAAELARWAERTLFVETRVAETEVSLRYRTTQLGRAYWRNDRQGVEYDVTDPISAALGGISGFVVIGSKALCLDADGSCQDGLASYLTRRVTLNLPSNARDCDPSNTFCAKYHSFFNKTDLGFLRQARHGGNTEVDGNRAPIVEETTCTTAALPDTLVEELHVRVLTGEDNLRGGDDNASAFVELDTGTRVFLVDPASGAASTINDGAELPSNTAHTKRLRLPTAVPLRRLRAFGLSTNFRGGVDGDNWDLRAIDVTTNSDRLPLLFRSFRPVQRFTGDRSIWRQAVRFDSPSSGTVITDLRVTIRTGGDDLRGGDDNAFFRAHLAAGPTTEQMINVGRSRLGDQTTTTITVGLGPETTLADLREAEIRTTFGGGSGGDNWNIDELRIDAQTASGSRINVLLASGSPVVRFTGEGRQRRWTLSRGSEPASCGSIRTLGSRFIEVVRCNIVKPQNTTPGGAPVARVLGVAERVRSDASAGKVETAVGGVTLGVVEGELDPDFEPVGASPGSSAPGFWEFEADGVCCAHDSTAGGSRTGNANHAQAELSGRCP